VPDLSTPNSPSQVAFPNPLVDILRFGSVNLFAGASGAGKTIMLAEWIARWQQGKTIWGHQTHCPTGFYFVAADRDWSTYQTALDNAGVDMASVHRYCLDEETTVQQWKSWKKLPAFDRLEYCLDRLKPIPGSLLVVEPFVPMFIDGRPNDATDTAVSLHFLRAITKAYQVTTCASANVTKLKQDEGFIRPQDRIAGSGALIAFSDTQIYLYQGDKPGQSHTFGWVPRTAAAEEFRVRFDPKTRLFRLDDGIFEPEQRLSHEDRIKALLELIPYDPPIERGELEALAHDAFGIHRSTVERDLKQLKRLHFIEWMAYGMIRRLPLS
jgi:AAA domain